MVNAEHTEPMLLRGEEVARTLGVSRAKVFRMMQHGEIPVLRLGRSVRTPRAALLDWIAAQTQQPTTASAA